MDLYFVYSITNLYKNYLILLFVNLINELLLNIYVKIKILICYNLKFIY